MRIEFQRAYHALLQDIVTIGVKLPTNNKPRTYRARKSDNLKAGDNVVIEVRGKMFVTEVLMVHEVPNFGMEWETDYKWIVCKVDDTQYRETLKREELFEQQLEAFTYDRNCMYAVNELAEHIGAEAAGYLAGIARGHVQPVDRNDMDAQLDNILRHVFGKDVQVVNLNSCEGLEDQICQMLAEGQLTTADVSQHVSTPRSERVDLESRYNKHIQNMHTYANMTWRDFMTYGADTLDTEAVRSAKMLFDRFKRKQYPIEAYIEEFKNKS